MNEIVNSDWQSFFNRHQIKESIEKINDCLNDRRQSGAIIYPKKDQIFRAFELSSLENTRVVILGQDPYHGEGEANGLAFSVNEGVKTPPSLRNIFKELFANYPDYPLQRSTNLSDWAEQGVLLLNSTLTVEKDLPNSHSKIGWQELTDEVIRYISDEKEGVVFVLLGNFAQSKKELIDTSKHKIIETTHPSPFSAHKGFLGSDLFLRVNDFLVQKGQKKIIW